VEREQTVATSASFMLGKLGHRATARFAERIAPLGLRPRHLGVLELIAPAPSTQLGLARALGVAPSVIVDMVDELEPLDAVRRRRDPVDRRRQLVELTERGRTLIALAASASREVDEELLARLDGRRRQAFLAALSELASGAGIPAAAPGPA
jgi:DNA-binding MarR family transcriptional regulator